MGIAEQTAQKAKQAAPVLASLSSNEKSEALIFMAKALLDHQESILAANQGDLEEAAKNGKTKAFIDRLTLTSARIKGIADSFETLAKAHDPVGEILGGMTRPNGLEIIKKRVPLGVIGVIFEARPNVTADVAALCIKSSNAVVLKGGSDALQTNRAIVRVLKQALANTKVPPEVVQLIDTADREATNELMRLNGIVDVLIPRGSAALIQSVVKNATVPVIETGAGNCHLYVDASADLDMALAIAENAKTQRPSVCNAIETLLVHRDAAEKFLPMLKGMLDKHNCEMRGCGKVRKIVPDCVPAAQEDWAKEYNDMILAVKVVDSLTEAIDHINKYGTKHSEAIVTRDYDSARIFENCVDAAAVYTNASTRFTDGGEFGFGAEIGISTQKLHARGPMGLEELTTYKYIINGNGQIRP